MLSYSELRNAACQALLYNVTPNMRIVAASLDANRVRLMFVFERSPSDEEKELAYDVAAETSGDFADPPEINVEFVVDSRHRRAILEEAGAGMHALYARHEP